MGNLEMKLASLPPDLLKEVEDYVDYLLQRRGLSPDDSTPAVRNPEAASNGPIIFAQEAPVSENRHIIPDFNDPGAITPPGGRGSESSRKEKEPQGILDWID